ncbi:hypothetical protein Tco_0665083 [Tanacetum coccineum]
MNKRSYEGLNEGTFRQPNGSRYGILSRIGTTLTLYGSLILHTTDSAACACTGRILDSEFSDEENKLEKVISQDESSQYGPIQQRKRRLFDVFERFVLLEKRNHQFMTTLCVFHKLVNDMKITQSIFQYQNEHQVCQQPLAYWGKFGNGFQKQFPPPYNPAPDSSNFPKPHATVHDGQIVTERFRGRLKVMLVIQVSRQRRHNAADRFHGQFIIHVVQPHIQSRGSTPLTSNLCYVIISSNQRCTELSKSNAYSRSTFTTKINALTAENAKLKTELSGKMSSGFTTSETPKVLAPGMYNLGSKYIPPPKCANWDKPTPLPKKKQVTFVEPPRPSLKPTQTPVVHPNKQTNVYVPMSIGVKPTSGDSKTVPKRAPRNHSSLPAKSANARRVEAHHRTLNKKNRVDSNLLVKHSVSVSNLNNVCGACNKSLVFANHTDCLVMCDGSVNVKPHQTKRFKRQPKKEWKPIKRVWQPISKPVANSKPQWKPTGRHFSLFEKHPLTRIMESTDQPIELPPSASSSPKITMVSRFADHKLSDRQAGSKGISGIFDC